MNIIYTPSPLLKEIKFRSESLPVVIRVNKFDEKAAEDFSKSVALAQNTGQPVLPIIIDSYGGQVYSLMSMISDIQHSRLPIATIVQGKAMSCGAILFSFGTEGRRYMDPDATVMIHDVSSMAWGKVEEVKVSAQETERLNQKVYKMMAKNCGHEENYFLDIVHEKGHADWFLDAKECRRHQLANKLHIPEMKIGVKVEFGFK
jgi:ATP-dependent Clp endopeptidase proteolytic subunit ClpP|tara:strand:+ start:527 stop:1135 length:609 start_codon:yes stop_codon:yes gene_type:complete